MYRYEGNPYCPVCAPDDAVMTIDRQCDNGTVTPELITKREYLKQCLMPLLDQAMPEGWRDFHNLLGDIKIDL